MVCPVCHAVLARDERRRRAGISLEPIFDHHMSERDLKAEAQKGECYICSTIYDRLQEQPLFPTAYQPPPEGSHFLSAAIRKVNYQQQAFRLDITMIRGGIFISQLPLVSFVLLGGAEIANTGPVVPVSGSTSDPEALDLAKGWIAECQAKHEKCLKPKDSFYPTRLLEVMTKDGQDMIDVRLVSQDDNEKLPNQGAFTGPYVTLSHRWANTRDVKVNRLKRDNLRKFQDGIGMDDLLLSFRHAVLVARHLKVRWLWIDSLCIVQDDKNDWLEQSATMDKVYQHSYCNISATAAVDSSQSLFRKRNRKREWCQKAYLHYGEDDEVPEEIHCTILDLSFWERQVNSAYVNKRSWVLQERVLSPRVLHFCSDQIAFECREFTRAESRPRGLPIPAVAGSEVEDILLFKSIDSSAGMQLYKARIAQEMTWGSQVSLNRQIANKSPQWYLYEVWKSKVEAYTKMGLTKATDRLIALSGIARMMQNTMEKENCKDQYLAGLWQGAFEKQLLWYVNESEDTTKEPQPYVRLRPGDDPKSYTAPTWSWASCESPRGITFADNSEQTVLIEMNIVRLLYQDTRDPFGQVTDGYIVLSGILRRICLRDRQEHTVIERADRMSYLVYRLQEQEKRMLGGKRYTIEYDPPRRRWQALGQLACGSLVLAFHYFIMWPTFITTIASVLLCSAVFVRLLRPALIAVPEEIEPANRWSWRRLDNGKAVGKEFTVVYLDSPASEPTIFGPHADVFVIPALQTSEHLVCLMVQAIGGDYGIRYKRIGLTKILAVEKEECMSIVTPPSRTNNAGGRYYYGPKQRRPGESTICII